MEVSRAPMQIFIKNLHGKTMLLEVQPNDKVRTLKQLIAERGEIALHAIELVYRGRTLEDEETLSEQNVQKHTVVHLVLRVYGGGCTAIYASA